jgi:kynurenine formamidase
MGTLPTTKELEGYFDELSNWGRWGEDDELGTLNLITPEVRRRAVALVSEGISVPLGSDLDPGVPDPLERGTTLQRYMVIGEGIAGSRLSGVREWIGMIPHGSHTHLDSLSHIHWDGKMYNGFPGSAVTSMAGATKLSIHNVREGVVTRGVLLDIAALRGADWLEAGEGVFPEELEAAEERQGVRVSEGDALLLFTGQGRRHRAKGLDPQHRTNGYTAACLPWLHERGVAVLSSEHINDVSPSGYGPSEPITPENVATLTPEAVNFMLPVHAVGLVAMGLWLVDNMVLDEAAATCERLGRWEFLFMMAPLLLVGATGSQVNPLAVF